MVFGIDVSKFFLLKTVVGFDFFIYFLFLIHHQVYDDTKEKEKCSFTRSNIWRLFLVIKKNNFCIYEEKERWKYKRINAKYV